MSTHRNAPPGWRIPQVHWRVLLVNAGALREYSGNHTEGEFNSRTERLQRSPLRKKNSCRHRRRAIRPKRTRPKARAPPSHQHRFSVVPRDPRMSRSKSCIAGSAGSSDFRSSDEAPSVGGLRNRRVRETQEMLDFCAEHGIIADVELIPIQQINEAYKRLLKSDVKYRFVIDMASLR